MPRKNVIAPLIFTVFVDLLGFGILIPVIPQLLANPTSEFFLLPAGFSIQSGYVLLGLLTAVYPLMQFFSAPILGELSDRFGRKPILAISLFGTTISYVLFAIGIMTKHLPLMFFSRFADGITGGNIAVAQAAIADVTDPAHRAKNFGLIGAAFGMGFILGPFLGGKLSDPTIVSWFNAATPFWFAAIISLLNTILVAARLPETIAKKTAKLKLHFAQSVKHIMKAYSLENLRPLFFTVFLFQAGFTFFTTFYSVFLINRFGFTQGSIGNFYAYVGLWIAFSQAFATRKFSKHFSDRQILSISIIATGFFLFSQFLVVNTWQLLLVIPFFALANGLTQAHLTSMISASVGPKIQGEILGITTSVQAFSQILPPVIAGIVAAETTAEVPLIVAGFLVVFAGIVFNAFKYKQSYDRS